MKKEIYNLSVEETLKSFETSENGLSISEAQERLKTNGLNKLKEGKKTSFLTKLIEQLKNIMIIILLIAAIISLVTAKINSEPITESIVIFVVVFLNIFLGAIQEAKAETAIEALKKMSLPYIKVRRGGKVLQVKTEELTIGDIVLLEAGDYVPADMRVLQSNSLRVDESNLTGESIPLSKITDVLSGKVDLAARRNMVYTGSSIVYGRGEGIVTAIGMNTQMGKIAKILTDTEDTLTPLQKKMNEISKMLSIIVVVIGLAMVLLGLFKSVPLLEIFMLAVSLAVAAIPEGLPASITIILSIGVQKMVKEHSIIRKLSSVETLGATQIICSDKTGTLTQNKMTVTAFCINNENVYDEVVKEEIKAKAEYIKLIECMSLCNDIKLTENENAFNWTGDPTEVALGNFVDNNGSSKIAIDEEKIRVAEVPFDSVRKMMSTINRNGKVQNGFTIYTKGAVESVISKCQSILLNGKVVKLDEKTKDKILKNNSEFSNNALRVLAFAYRESEEMPQNLEATDIEQDLIFIGLACMIDPPRPEVKEAVKNAFMAGMTPIMITGDNIDTAVAIAKQVGILSTDNQSTTYAITGSMLDEMTDSEFEKNIENIRVYARVSPENKVRIVNTWKKIGKTVAMTGDGVNDAPALKVADIGVGMGITGTEVSKSVASMILTDDNFASIVVAVKEGRRIYTNIQNVIVYLLASNIAEVIIVFISMLLNSEIFSSIQLLWINLVTDALPAMMLGFEPAAKNIMSEKPRDNNEKFFTPFLLTRIFTYALIKSIIVLVVYFISQNLFGHAVATTISFITLSLIELLFSFTVRSDRKAICSIGIFSNPQMFFGVFLVILLQVLVTMIPGAVNLLGIVNLNGSPLLIAYIVPIAFFFIAEIVKIIIAKAFKIS